MRGMRLTRRTCLISLLALTPPLVARTIWSTGGSSPLRQLAQLMALLPRDSAIEIGQAYLRTYVDGALERSGAAALAAVLVAPGVLRSDELKRRLAESVRDDFRARRIVRVGQWHLALTEARLCALVALHTKQANQQRALS
jgi:hypothetical protein